MEFIVPRTSDWNIPGMVNRIFRGRWRRTSSGHSGNQYLLSALNWAWTFEIYGRICFYFHIYIDALYLGGPQLFQGGLPAYYSFDDNSSPKINIIVFGVPQPIVEGEIIYKKLNVLNKSVNTYTHNFTMELPQMTQKACGKELTVIATGYNGTLIEKVKSFCRKL